MSQQLSNFLCFKIFLLNIEGGSPSDWDSCNKKINEVISLFIKDLNIQSFLLNNGNKVIKFHQNGVEFIL